MTDRVHSLVVVLEKDIRIDDAQALISAIGCMRGVSGVTPNISDFSTHTAEHRVRSESTVLLYNLARAVNDYGLTKVAEAIEEMKR